MEETVAMSECKVCVYVSESGSKAISAFHMSPETGALTKVQSVSLGGKVMPLAISPNRRFLYASIRSEPYRIESFAIDGRDGTLTHLGGVDAPNSTVHIGTDHTGRFLIGVCNPTGPSRRTGILTVNPIGPQGCAVAPVTMVRTPPKLHSSLMDPSNRFVIAASCNGDMIVRLAFDGALGTLDQDGLAPVLVVPGAGPRHMRFHPNGNFMYLINEYDGTVYAFRYDARKGSLTELQIVNATPPDYTGENRRAADLQFTPDGQWLYASVRNSVTLTAFRVDPVTGLLSLVGHYPTAKEPRGFAIDPFGRHLIVAGMLSNCLAMHAIDPKTGALGAAVEYPTGEGPNWIEIVRL